MVTAERLFFNMPARRKFLKTITTEMGHIVDAVTKIALGWPEVQFRLTHNGKRVKNWPATGDPVDRIVDVLGIDIKDDLCKIEFSADDLSITGWISSNRNTRRTSRGIYICVNGRVVRDRIIQHALFEGYSGRLVKGQFPLAVLFIHAPYDQVDVNVHPAKHEVRFAHQKNVHEAVRRAVARALHRADLSGWTAPEIGANRPSMERFGIFEPIADFELSERKRKDAYSREIGISTSYRPTPLLKQDLGLDETGVQTPLWEKKRFGDLRVIGQFRDMYILCESGDGLILIDQHAAHERILFEQLKKRFKDAKKTSQKLLIPETIDLGYREAKILERLIPNLNELGLEIAPFGGDTFVVNAVPLLLKNKEIKPLLIEIVEKIAQIGFSSGMETVLDQCLELMACHGAIRANQRLSDKEIRELLHQLDTCDQPSNCPHGRPTWVSWSSKDLEKLFKRIV
jgi:DNA mismatch repair protein MutL